MNETDVMYIALGFILAIAGFGFYAMQVFQAWKDEKKKIEEDFTLSKQYEPEKSIGMVMVFLAIASTSVIFVLMMTMLLYIFGEDGNSLPVATDLVAKFIMLMGATSLIGNIARIPNSKYAVRDMAYHPALPDDIKEAMNAEKDLNKRYKIMNEYIEDKGLMDRRQYFGKYLVINVIPETNNIYMLLMIELLLVFSGLMDAAGDVQDIDPGFSSTMFATGVLFVLLTIPSVFFMKKAADIEMSDENFGKKILMTVYGAIPPIIGLVIMTYTVMGIMG